MNSRGGKPWGITGTAALLGVLAALSLLPRARTTVAAQVALALGRRPEWLQATYGGPSPRLEREFAAAPTDVELQIGAATLPEVIHTSTEANEAPPPPRPDGASATLARLEAAARRFPDSAAVRAHQLRHLTRNA